MLTDRTASTVLALTAPSPMFADATAPTVLALISQSFMLADATASTLLAPILTSFMGLTERPDTYLLRFAVLVDDLDRTELAGVGSWYADRADHHINSPTGNEFTANAATEQYKWTLCIFVRNSPSMMSSG